MLEAKEASQAALAAVRDLMGSGAANITLEELEWAETEKQWHVTVGYNEGSGMGVGLRRFKLVVIDADTGRVVAMRMRAID